MSRYLKDFRAGDTVPIVIDYGRGCDDSTPPDKSGYDWWFSIKREIDDPDNAAVLRVKSADSSEAETEKASGIGRITLTSSQTIAIPPGQYYWSLVEVSSAGEVRTLMPLAEHYDDRIRVAPAGQVTYD